MNYNDTSVAILHFSCPEGYSLDIVNKMTGEKRYEQIGSPALKRAYEIAYRYVIAGKTLHLQVDWERLGATEDNLWATTPKENVQSTYDDYQGEEYIIDSEILVEPSSYV